MRLPGDDPATPPLGRLNDPSPPSWWARCRWCHASTVRLGHAVACATCDAPDKSELSPFAAWRLGL